MPRFCIYCRRPIRNPEFRALCAHPACYVDAVLARTDLPDSHPYKLTLASNLSPRPHPPANDNSNPSTDPNTQPAP
jgi:hypothetical protein